MSVATDLVVFGEDWGAHPSSTQHLVGRLARDREVVWFDSIGLRRPRLAMRDLGRLARKGLAMARRPATPARGTGGPHIHAPRALPFPGNPLARRLNRRLLGGAVRRAVRAAGIERPLLWLSLPTAVDAIGSAGERAVIYYCGDDFAALAGVDHEPVARLEQELVARADLVLAASPALAARFPAGKTRLLEHGADVTLFSTPAPRADDLPTRRPVAGFYGSLADWFDVGLVAACARRLSDWDFVLIGPRSTDLSALERLPNVHLLGPRAHAALPGYAQHWDASLLPFRDNAQIRACNPLKLREYLAAGRPIVSTDFPALDGYRDLVDVIDGADALVSALRRARLEGTARSMMRQERVAAQSWDARAAQLSGWLDGF